MPTPTGTRTLFLAWQDESSRRWYTVGRLDHVDGLYRFRYTEGARKAQEAGFQAIISFPVIGRTYKSNEIFPLFANQVLSERRPEYAEFIDWLALPESEADPVAILARTSEHVSNTLEIYPQPEKEGDHHVLHFFARGTRHQPQASQERISKLEPDERLRIAADFQNEFDPHACLLRTDEQYDGDMHILGYLPRYLASEIGRVIQESGSAAFDKIRKTRIEVVRVNESPTPVHFRLLCRASVDGSTVTPFTSDEHTPIA